MSKGKLYNKIEFKKLKRNESWALDNVYQKKNQSEIEK